MTAQASTQPFRDYLYQDRVRNDPLYYFLTIYLSLGVSKVVLLSMAYGVLTTLIAGFISDLFFDGPGTRIYDVTHLPFAIFASFFIIPTVFGVYVWQSAASVKAFVSLRINGCIGEPKNSTEKVHGSTEDSKYLSFVNDLVARLFNKLLAITSLLFGVAMTALAHFYAWPIEAVPYGGSHYILDVAWYELILIFNIIVLGYMLWSIIVRQVLITLQIDRLSEEFHLIVRPLDPDRAGGFSGMGDYLIRTGLVAVMMGFVVLGYSLQIWLVGFNPLTRPDVILFWVIYISTIMIVTVWPVLSLHNAMVDFKKSKLQPVAEEYESWLKASLTHADTTEGLKLHNERLEEVEKRFNQIDLAYVVWPANTDSLMRFAVTAVLPLATNLIPLLFS